MSTKTLAVHRAIAKPKHRADFTKTTPIGVLGVSGLRSFPSRDGIAFFYGLTLNGQPAAIVRDEGNGGMMDVRWSNPETETLVTKYAESLPGLPWEDRTIPFTVDLMLAELADEADEAGKGR